MKTAGSIFRATQDSSGRITIIRTPPCDGINNTFTFNNGIEIRTALSSSYEQADIDRLLQELADSGSADFWIQTEPPLAEPEISK
jgi:hypothetical protein